MTTEPRETQEEKAYRLLIEEVWEVLSQAAINVVSTAHGESHALYIYHNSSYQEEDYEEAIEKLRSAAIELTDRDCELLARLCLAALAVAASVDPEDDSPGAYYISWRGTYHWYYRMISDLIRETLQARRSAEEQLPEERLGVEIDPALFEGFPF